MELAHLMNGRQKNAPFGGIYVHTLTILMASKVRLMSLTAKLESELIFEKQTRLQMALRLTNFAMYPT